MPETTLVDRLTEAAANVIANERQGLAYDPQRIRGVTIELEVSGGGVCDSRVYVERRGKVLARKPPRGALPGAPGAHP